MAGYGTTLAGEAEALSSHPLLGQTEDGCSPATTPEPRKERTADTTSRRWGAAGAIALGFACAGVVLAGREGVSFSEYESLSELKSRNADASGTASAGIKSGEMDPMMSDLSPTMAPSAVSNREHKTPLIVSNAHERATGRLIGDGLYTGLDGFLVEIHTPTTFAVQVSEEIWLRWCATAHA